jgi:Eco29kI restriction endonuclease
MNTSLRSNSVKNITLNETQCRYLTFVGDWWVFAAEFALMVHYKPEWNASGFGSKTPGIGGPGTDRISRWDDPFPPKTGPLVRSRFRSGIQSKSSDASAHGELLSTWLKPSARYGF